MEPGHRYTRYTGTSVTDPATGRRRKRAEPFSKWQKLVIARMDELQLSSRALASKISSPARQVGHTALWAWLRHPEGKPPKQSYDLALNRRLAKALGITPESLMEAFEESNRVFVLKDAQSTSSSALSMLRRLVDAEPGETLKKADVVQWLDTLQGR
jgi:hypothetical protein